MKRKNGFTLIELLAVIVILAIIALISTPIIIGVIEKARRGAFEDSAYGVLDAAKIYFTEKLADTNGFDYTEFDFNGDMKDLKIGGEKPYGGSLLIDDDGKQALAIYDKDKKWCATKTFEEEKIRIIDNYKKCDKDIAENLIINGYGEYGDNTNFSKFTYKDGAFVYNSNERMEVFADTLVFIDPKGTYEISVEAKSNNTASTHYAGIMEYDIDQERITPNFISYVPNTQTELLQDLKDGDTTVYLKDLSQWMLTPISSSYPALNQGFIFWNYKDSTGYMYPPETYSRNVYQRLYEYSNIHKDSHTITLNQPWSKGLISAGTKVSQTHSGSVFNYSLLSNRVLTTSYQKFQNQISGDRAADYEYTKFRSGTKFSQFAIIHNNSSQAGVTVYYKNIVLKKIHT